MRRPIILIVSLAVVAALPAAAPAKRDPGVIKTGRCSNGASWKLKAKHDDPAGPDRIVASARAARGSQLCRVVVSI